ncbi:MarR family transcriptional regulator [Erythrobacter sp.]|jgi:hypothetical protein|uniref:MarR family transcriptional regulator n=1 Tax=Erythrobacter sp. TaxID=1042 RepID=UPI002EBCF8E8|nr:MarR family transcriptional regulator [Erythrobacter sp.]
MKELNARPFPSAAQGGDTPRADDTPDSSVPDLGVLAEQLSAIAAILRENGEPSGPDRTQSRAHIRPALSLADLGFSLGHTAPRTPPRESGGGAAHALASARKPSAEPGHVPALPRPDPAQPRTHHVQLARNAYARRRKRSEIFGEAEIFGEPAWDILLDLYIAQADGTPVSVSSACIGSAAPPTTGLRWLGVLADHGLILREHDPRDQRRVLVRLTQGGLAAMDRYFAAAGDLGQS